MQLLTICVATLFTFVLFLNSVTDGHNIDFPVQVCISAINSGNYLPCVTQLATNIWKLHNWSEDTAINICDLACTGNLKGRFSKWQWKWDGRFQCNSKVPGIVGHQSKKSKNGAMEWAIQDFLYKAITSGQLKPQDLQC